LKPGGIGGIGGVSVSAALDEAAELVAREIPGWAGLLAITALPLRFLEVHFFNRLLQLGDNAPGYVNHLISLSFLIAVALLPALWGRAVFVKACALALSGRGRGISFRSARPSFPAFVSYGYAAVVAELLFVALGWTVVALPAIALYAGLAAATSYLQERPGPLASLAAPIRVLRVFFPFLGLTGIFAIALFIAWLNLFVLFRLGLWLAGGASGLDLSWWSATMNLDNQHFLLLLLAGAMTVVEPFWLAALVAAVRKVRARETGEDLVSWFSDIRAEEEIPGEPMKGTTA